MEGVDCMYNEWDFQKFLNFTDYSIVAKLQNCTLDSMYTQRCKLIQVALWTLSNIFTEDDMAEQVAIKSEMACMIIDMYNTIDQIESSQGYNEIISEYVFSTYNLITCCSEKALMSMMIRENTAMKGLTMSMLKILQKKEIKLDLVKKSFEILDYILIHSDECKIFFDESAGDQVVELWIDSNNQEVRYLVS